MADLHSNSYDISVGELNAMNARMLAFIFPNTPVTQDEVRAFENAVLLQVQHEKAIKASGMGEIPEGVTSFQIGHFTMSFADGYSSSSGARLTRKTICDGAYGLLLRAGLLYKGVERECGHGIHFGVFDRDDYD